MANKSLIDISKLNIELAERQIECLSPEYLGSREKYEFHCLVCNNVWNSVYDSVINNKSGCPYCKSKQNGIRLRLKINIEQLNKKLTKRNIKFISPKYLNVKEKHEFLCLICGNRWFAIYENVVNNMKGCPECGKEKRAEFFRLKITIDEINRKLKERNIECLSKNEDYRNNHSKLIFQCLICDYIWVSTYGSTVNAGHGCFKCAIKKKENHHNWKGGKSNENYPPEWNESKREFIRNRDERKCQYPDCNYTDIGKNRKLDVHHIDGNKRNNENSNLISLCVSCHAKIENTNPISWEDYFYEYTNSFEL